MNLEEVAILYGCGKQTPSASIFMSIVLIRAAWQAEGL